MKINKQKHGKENTIGKIIYGFLMFMPLMAIAVTCITHFFNKEVSGYGETATPVYKYQSNQVNSTNDLITGRIYTVTINAIDTYPSSYVILFSCYAIYNYQNNSFEQQTTAEEDNYFIYRIQNNNNYIQSVPGYKNVQALSKTEYTYPLKFDIVLRELNDTNFTYITSIEECTDIPIDHYEVTETSVDNSTDIFYYSIDKVEQSPLFNWATETGTHDVLESTCQTLGITTSFVPMLLAYWLMMSLMYLLYDIALLIVHMAHNRIHDIESSI